MLYNYESDFPYFLRQILQSFLGMGKMLSELREQFEPVSERRLLERLSEYKGVLIASGQKISGRMRDALSAYVLAGGSVYLEYDSGFSSGGNFFSMIF